MKRLLKSALMCVLAWWSVLPVHAQVVAVATPSNNATERAPVDERAMKAAYLYNFAVFTQWPGTPSGAFQFCVLGQSALDGELRKLPGRPVQGGAPLAVRRVSGGDDLEPCRVLYIDESQKRLFKGALVRLNGYPVLTVTDADELLDEGAMIGIRRSGNRLAFDINLVASRRVRLDFSARLLKLAGYVNDGS
jgi:hypothetical protein